MQYVINKRTPVATRGAKVCWLRAHQLLWEVFLPDDHQNWAEIVKLMKADGLVALTTYPLDVNLPSLMADAYSR